MPCSRAKRAAQDSGRRIAGRAIRLKLLCTVAQKALTQILRTALHQPKGLPAFFLTLHTFGEYLDL